MRLIHNIIEITLKDGNCLFVNGLSGAVDLIYGKDLDTLQAWKKEADIQPKTINDKALFDKLVSRKYIMTETEEANYKEQLIKKLQARQNTSLSAQCAWFVLSYNCNFACPYCYESGVPQGNVMSKEMIDRVFSLNPDIKSIGLFGGEPLLLGHKALIEHIIEQAPKDAAFFVITNGYYLEEYVDTLSKVNVKNIQVTLDGTEHRHNMTRILRNGMPSYQKILSGIRLCVKNDLPVTIRMNLSRDNMQDCFTEKAHLQETEWGQKLSFELQPLFQSDIDDHQMIFDEMFTNDHQDPYGTNRLLEKMSVLSNFLYNNTPMRPVLKACDTEGQNRFYDSEGNIYNCILAVGNPEKSIGTYYPDAVLKEKSFLTRDITKIEKCKNCAAALLCGGGCPNGIPAQCDLYSPNCWNYLHDINYTIPQIWELKNSVK